MGKLTFLSSDRETGRSVQVQSKRWVTADEGPGAPGIALGLSWSNVQLAAGTVTATSKLILPWELTGRSRESGNLSIRVVYPPELAPILEVSRIPSENTSSGIRFQNSQVSSAKQPVTIIIEGENKGRPKQGTSHAMLNKKSNNPTSTMCVV